MPNHVYSCVGPQQESFRGFVEKLNGYFSISGLIEFFDPEKTLFIQKNKIYTHIYTYLCFPPKKNWSRSG